MHIVLGRRVLPSIQRHGCSGCTLIRLVALRLLLPFSFSCPLLRPHHHSSTSSPSSVRLISALVLLLLLTHLHGHSVPPPPLPPTLSLSRSPLIATTSLVATLIMRSLCPPRPAPPPQLVQICPTLNLVFGASALTTSSPLRPPPLSPRCCLWRCHPAPSDSESARNMEGTLLIISKFLHCCSFSQKCSLPLCWHPRRF